MNNTIIKFILICFIFTFITSCSSEEKIAYKTETVVDTSIIKKTVATGSIVPRKEVNIKSQVSGIVEKLFVVAGMQIKEGDVVAKIKIIPNMLNLANAENRINAAQINNDNAKIDYDRNKSLLDQGVISKQEFQQYDLRLKSTTEELDAAKNQLQIIKDGVAKSSQHASNTMVKSTISGMILDVPIKEGGQVIESNTFNEGTTICSVANMNEMIFEGKLDESEVGKISNGNTIELTIGAIDKLKFNAQLEYISPKGINEAGAMQFIIKAKIDTKAAGSNFLRAGYSANADIILAKKDKVLAVSESVLQFEGDKTFVEVVVGENKFEKRYVKTGLSDAIITEIVEGLKKGDKIKVPELTKAEDE
ncbi:MAG: efflux RND transporter periplasmic adaptor subunit [Bacteroidetes bacterium]|nr:efflux RND transporter periplasmic adaptor subunit [Bacteroidota bacterium]